MARGESIIRFGADGWQARFDGGFTEDNIARLIEAVGLLWAEEAPAATVYVGYDTRHNAREHARLAAQVLSACGLAPVLSNAVCPTPAVAWACAQDPAAVGAVIITASKRSCEYGGVLLRRFDGSECPREFLNQVEEIVAVKASTERGSFEERDLVTPYIDNLLSYADANAIRSTQLKVVVDPMYGSAKGYLARALESLGCEVVEIHGEDLADFGNIHPEPADPWADKCAQAVMATGADMGLLLDGDGDRSGVVDERGTMLTPQAHVALVLDQIVAGLGRTGRVVTTLSTSSLVTRQAHALGLACTAVPVGFTRLYREMCEGDVILAAEEYGGIGFPPHLLERDGILACMLMVELVARTRKRPHVLVEELEQKLGRLCYARRDIRLEPAQIQSLRNVLPGFNPAEVAGMRPVEVSHADGMRLDFEDGSWILVRPSRSDAIVRIYAEAPSEKERDALLEGAANSIKGSF